MSTPDEVTLWKKKWDSIEKTMRCNLHKTVSATSSYTSFPHVSLADVNIGHRCGANSEPKLVKTIIRSTMRQDRRKALVVLRVHKDIKLDFYANIDKCSRKHPRFNKI